MTGGRHNIALPRLPDLPDAACRGREPTLWDERVDGEDIAEATLRRSVARAICHDCPERRACADAREDSAGVWAGQVWLTRANGRVTLARYGQPDPGPPPEEPRARPVRITDDKRRQALELHEQGYANRHVAAVVGISSATVSRVVREAGEGQ
jgi:DNA-binding NarL/FixJ family response regulator